VKTPLMPLFSRFCGDHESRVSSFRPACRGPGMSSQGQVAETQHAIAAQSQRIKLGRFLKDLIERS